MGAERMAVASSLAHVVKLREEAEVSRAQNDQLLPCTSASFQVAEAQLAPDLSDEAASRFFRILPESQHQNRALTVWYVPNSLNSGSREPLT